MFPLSIAIGYSNKRFFAAMAAAWFASWLNFTAMAETNQFDQAHLDYNLKTSLEAYDKVGRKDPRWDADAKAALEGFSRLRAMTNGNLQAMLEQVEKSVTCAVSNGCSDPLIQYLHFRYALDRSFESNAASFIKACQAVQNSAYPDIRKAWASAWEGTTVYRQNAEAKEIDALLTKTASFLGKAFENKSIPLREVDQVCEYYLGQAKHGKNQMYKYYHLIEAPLDKNLGETWVALLYKGMVYIDWAWQARGGGYSDTVSDAGWKLFEERLQVAASSLEKAWRINPHEVRICQEMMRVELGQGQGRDRLELWFERGMKLDPANYELCRSKLYYLLPRWHGSAAELLRFGRFCTANTNYVGNVRLLLVDAYEAVAMDIKDKEQQRKFWENPRVWQDIQNTFEQFFKLYPNEVGFRHNYAKCAARCCQAQAFLDQVKMFPSTNYNYFGGKDQFDAMVKGAQEHLK